MPQPATDATVYLETADVSRELGLTPATVRHHARNGTLPAAATTPRGGRLFRVEDVQQFKRDRDARRKQVA